MNTLSTLKPIAYAALLMTALSSCDKQKLLLEEKARAEAELQRATDEHKFYEGKFLALGSQVHTAVASIERQTAALEKGATVLELEVSGLSAKVSALEAAMSKYKPIVESYKAKFSR